MKVYLKVALPRRFGGQETPPRTLDNNCVAFAPNVNGAEATQNTHKHSLALSRSLLLSVLLAHMHTHITQVSRRQFITFTI